MQTVKKAEGELNKLISAKEKLIGEISALENKSQQEKTGSVKSVITDLLSGTKSADKQIDQAGKIKAELEAKQSATGELEIMIDQAQKDVIFAEAEAKRQGARQLREQAAKHKIKTDQLLAELKAHEDCKYVPQQERPIPGVYQDSRIWETPKSDKIIGEAKRLEEQAEILERKAAGDNLPAQKILSA